MRYCIFFAVFFFNTSLFAQKQNNVWVLTSGALMDFNYIPPKVISGVINESLIRQSMSSMSDSLGKLLLFTDGINAWNKDFELIEGNPLYTLQLTVDYNPSIIIPVPLEKNNYYIFTLGFNRGFQRIFYAKVDMNANKGKGRVVFKEKLLDEDRSYRTLSIAVGASNCEGIFLLTNNNYNNEFLVYQIISSGIKLLITKMNHKPEENIGEYSPFYMSPDGKLVGNGTFGPYLYQFDTNTGYFNPQGIKINNLRGLSESDFSYDSKRFYTSTEPSTFIPPLNGEGLGSYVDTFKLFQYDVSIFESSKINTSAKALRVIKNRQNSRNRVSIALSPHKKLYVVESVGTADVNPIRKYYAHEIVNPNAGNPPAYIKDSVLMFNEGRYSGNMLVNYLRNYYEHLPKLLLPNSFCVGDSLQLKADTAYTSTRYKWFVNDTLISTEAQPKIKLDKVGKQNITLHINECLVEQDIEVSPSLVPILKDTSLCEAQPIRLTAPSNGSKYLWNTQDTTQSISIATGGKYQVKVSNTCNQILDSANVKLYPRFYDFLNPNTEVCEQDQVSLTAPKGATKYLWSNGDTTASISITQAGKYKVELSNRCYALSDSTEVIFFNEIYKTTGQNLITANGDGANEELILFNHELKDYTLSIYNRWGARVFVSHNSKEAWKPSEVEAGVYYYSVNAAYCNGKTYEQKGWVQVMK